MHSICRIFYFWNGFQHKKSVFYFLFFSAYYKCMKIRMVQCGLKASWMVNIDHILTATDLVTSNTYMDEKDTESITRTHGFGLFVMVTSYFNSNNYKHTVTFTRNLLEAAFCGLFFLQKSIPQKCGMLNKINHNIQGNHHLLHYYYCFHNYLLKQWLDIRLYTHW